MHEQSPTTLAVAMRRAQLDQPPILEPSVPGKQEEEKDEDPIVKREQNWLSWLRLGIVVTMAIITIVLLSTFVLHLVLPVHCRWLPASEVENIKSLAVTIAVGLAMSFATSYFFKKEL